VAGVAAGDKKGHDQAAAPLDLPAGLAGESGRLRMKGRGPEPAEQDDSGEAVPAVPPADRAEEQRGDQRAENDQPGPAQLVRPQAEDRLHDRAGDRGDGGEQTGQGEAIVRLLHEQGLQRRNEAGIGVIGKMAHGEQQNGAARLEVAVFGGIRSGHGSRFQGIDFISFSSAV